MITPNYRSLLLVGICLPAAIAAIDYAVLGLADGANLSPLATAALLSLFVLQVGLVGWSVARFISHWPLRWFLWLWIMLLIDLQLVAMSTDEGFPSHRILDGLATGMIAGQIGSIVVWGVLGTGAFVWRVPALLLMALISIRFYFLMLRVADTQETPVAYIGWSDLMTLETTMLAAVCFAIRLSGFQLAPFSDQGSARLVADRAKHKLQFGIRHVLIGTTTLAAALGLAKAGNMLTKQFGQRLYDESFLFVAIVAAGTAAVLLVALWASLGRGNAVLRVFLAIVFPLLVGSAVAAYCVVIGQPQLFAINARYWMFTWYETGYWWIAFMILTALLLAASLIIFRTRGYRLVHSEGRLENRLTVQPLSSE